MYVAGIGILFMPVYLHLMGPELFGLLGVYVALQAFLQAGDLGLSSALLREFSRFRAGILGLARVQKSLRAVEGLVTIIGFLVFMVVAFCATKIASDYLVYKAIPTSEVADYILLISLATLPRLLVGVYKNVLIGLERQKLANALIGGFATLRYALVVPIMVFSESKGYAFFLFQVAVSMLELFVFNYFSYLQLKPEAKSVIPDLRFLRNLWPVALPMAFLSAAWVLLTNLDRVILAKILDLSSYGFFTLSAIAAAGILSFIPPLAQILLPRMTILISQGETGELVALYRLSTQVVASFFLSMGGTLYVFSLPTLYAWTGDHIVAAQSARIFGWYALANAVAGILYLPFLLQFAFGQLRLHFIGNLLSLALQVPAMIWSGVHYGALGVALSILCVRVGFLTLWTPIVLRRFVPTIMFSWLVRDILPIGLVVMLVLVLLEGIFANIASRIESAFILVFGFCISFVLSLMLSPAAREMLLSFVRKTN